MLSSCCCWPRRLGFVQVAAAVPLAAAADRLRVLLHEELLANPILYVLAGVATHVASMAGRYSESCCQDDTCFGSKHGLVITFCT